MPFKVCRYGIAGLPLASPVSELHSLNSLAPPVDSHYIAMHQTLFDLAEDSSDAVTLHHVLSPDIISILSDAFLSPSIVSHFSFLNNFYILYYILHVCIAGSLPCPLSIQSDPQKWALEFLHPMMWQGDMPDMKVMWNNGSLNFGMTYICWFEYLWRFWHLDSQVQVRCSSVLSTYWSTTPPQWCLQHNSSPSTLP